MKSAITQQLVGLANRYPVARQLLRPAIALRRSRQKQANAQTVRLYERLAASFAEDPCVKVEEFGGSFFVDARSALFRRIIEDGVYEPVLSALCRESSNPARDVLDIGANVGFHSVMFGRWLTTGRVVAVEPTRNALARLHRNLARNAVADKVTVFEGVVSDSPGVVEIKTIAGREEYSSIGEMAHPSIAGVQWQAERVASSTVDQLVLEHGLKPGFMKIDVEGAEHLVIQGAGNTLGTHRPTLLLELSNPLLRSNGSSSQSVIDQIAAYDYEITDPLNPGVTPGQREFGDILCRPR